MSKHVDRLLDTEWDRRPSTLKLAYVSVDTDGVTQQAWGVQVDGDLPLNPWSLRKELGRLPWPDRDDAELPDVDVYQIEGRSNTVQIVAEFVVQALPSAFIGAAVAEALRAVLVKLGPWSKPRWHNGPTQLGTSEEILAYATRRAKEIAYNHFRDIPDDPPDITVLSQHLAPVSDLNEAAPTIVLRTSDGQHFTIQIYMSPTGEQYSITRSG